MRKRREQAMNGLYLFIFVVIPFIGIVLGYTGMILDNDQLWKIGVWLAFPLIVIVGSMIAAFLFSGMIDLVNDVYAALCGWVRPRS